MAHQASSKPDSGSSSTATIGSMVDFHLFGILHSAFRIASAWGQHFIHHVAPQSAVRDSANAKSDATSQVLNEAKNNIVALPGDTSYDLN
jgi:hypothetical protein